MNAFLKAVWTDLVEKRLWPVGAMLLVALVAVPFVLASGSSDSSTPTAIAGGTGDTSDPTSTTLTSTTPEVKQATLAARHPANAKRDPFTQIKSVKPASTTTTPAATPTPASSTSTPAGSDSPSSPSNDSSTTITSPLTTKDGTPTTTPAKPKAAPKAKDDPLKYTVDLRVGQSGDLKTLDNVQRLSPLPSTADPFLVFMGVMKDGKTAVFLLSSDVKATGSGVCHPSAAVCQSVEMKATDIEFFDVATSDDPTSAPLQYELDLNKIDKNKSDSTTAISAKAARATARSVHAGHVALAKAANDGNGELSSYTYSPRTGTLTRELPSLSSALGSIPNGAGSGTAGSSSVAVTP